MYRLMFAFAPRSHDAGVGVAGACANAVVDHEAATTARASAVLMTATVSSRHPMDDTEIRRQPSSIPGIVADNAAIAFTMMSEPKVGALLAALAASKPGGRVLELGTGTGHGTAWLLSGMDAASTLDTVDTDE